MPKIPRRAWHKRRLVVAMSVAYSFFGLLILLLAEPIFYNIGVSLLWTYALGLTTTLAGVGGLLLAYLRGDLISKESTLRLDDEINRLNEQLAIVRSQVEKDGPKPKFSELPMEERAALRTELKTELQSALSSEIISQIEHKFSAEIAENAQLSQIRNGFERTVSRLRLEISALSRRSNVNLVIGVLTTVVAVSLLAYLVLRSPTVPFSGLADILSHFIPRISVAVFIEVFSFFFLRLYKSNLEEIKYFQNELTNVEMKVIALESLLLTDEKKSSDTIIQHLVQTDRNLTRPFPDHAQGGTVEAKDIADLLDKIGKILNVGDRK